MLPIAYDIQVASKGPEDPNIKKLLIMAILLGCIEAGLSLFWAYGVPYITIFQGTYLLGTRASVNKGCDTQTQAIIWLNMFVASELLIFSTRAQSYMLFSVRPSYSLISGVFIGCLIICIIAGQSSTFGSLPAVDICYVWIWNIFWIFIIDIIKVEVIKLFQESTEVLADIEFAKGAEEAEVKPEGETPAAADGPVLVSVDPSGQLVQVKVDENTMNKRENAELARMASNIEITRKLTEGKLGTLVNTQSASNTALVTATRSPSSVVLVQRLGSVINAPRSASGGALTNNASSTSLGSVATINSVSTTSGTDMRGNSLIISGPLIPNTPASLAVIKKSRVRKA